MKVVAGALSAAWAHQKAVPRVAGHGRCWSVHYESSHLGREIKWKPNYDVLSLPEQKTLCGRLTANKRNKIRLLTDMCSPSSGGHINSSTSNRDLGHRRLNEISPLETSMECKERVSYASGKVTESLRRLRLNGAH